MYFSGIAKDNAELGRAGTDPVASRPHRQQTSALDLLHQLFHSADRFLFPKDPGLPSCLPGKFSQLSRIEILRAAGRPVHRQSV